MPAWSVARQVEQAEVERHARRPHHLGVVGQLHQREQGVMFFSMYTWLCHSKKPKRAAP
ncbi:MAG: hypothetical protein R2746_00515 [Acidimicrobiales bacterium]